MISFRLNGETVKAEVAATETLLDWLREKHRLTGTKEGCNEGDCGACSVIVTGDDGVARATNSCITFMPQLHGKSVRTVEGISGPDQELHPIQSAMIKHHGSQCGFCTPGFISSLSAAHSNGARNHDDQIAGNLCRCTGYAPIIKAAEVASEQPVPNWMVEQPFEVETSTFLMPKTTDELARIYRENPDATLVGGATDIGLWVTKKLAELEQVVFLSRCEDLKTIEDESGNIRIGAGVTIAQLQETIRDIYPSFGEMLRRFGSVQVRNSATIGGNIANGSPIGDASPALISLGATLHLRKGSERREILLEDFFLSYGKQDRERGEFVEALTIPRQPNSLKCYKLSKRHDQDISAVCGCFNIDVKGGMVRKARIAFGGMAGTPKRANNVERSLIDKEWSEEIVENALAAFELDYTPLSDMRASASYRLKTAKNMLRRTYLESLGIAANVLEVNP